jgi:lactoylglutathione lyase
MRLDHVAVHVANLERSLAFYRDVLNLRVEARFRLHDEELVFLSTDDGLIELIHDATSPRPTGLVDHLALRVDDLDAWLRRVKSSGIRLLDASPISVPDISARIAFCLGPDAERIEFIQR